MSTPISDPLSLDSTPTTMQPPSNTFTHELWDEPLVVQAGSSWRIFDFAELWAHRELLYFLMLRDLKVRYKQTILGVAWAVLQPAVMAVIFTVFLGLLVRVPSGGLPYPLLVFTGLLPWTFFSGSVLAGGQSLVGNAALITKVYFPRLLIPAATVAARLVDFAISFVILAALILYFWLVSGYRIDLTWQLLIFPLMVLLMVLLTLGLSILVSCINVKYRDVGVALPVLVQLWMFVSPIVYSADLVPEKWRVLYSLNPLVGLVGGFRASLLGTEIPILAITITAVTALMLLVFASLLFRRTEKTFADVV